MSSAPVLSWNKKLLPSTFKVTNPLTTTTVSAASSNAFAMVIGGNVKSPSASILNLAPFDQYTPTTASITSPASSVSGNPTGSPVLESQRISTVSLPNVNSKS